VTYQERDYNSDGSPLVDRKVAPFTKFYSPASIFSITPCTEEMARAAMKSWHVEPIQYFELRQLPAPLVEREMDHEEDIDGNGDDARYEDRVEY